MPSLRRERIGVAAPAAAPMRDAPAAMAAPPVAAAATFDVERGSSPAGGDDVATPARAASARERRGDPGLAEMYAARTAAGRAPRGAGSAPTLPWQAHRFMSIGSSHRS